MSEVFYHTTLLAIKVVVVVAQLAEQLLPLSEVPGYNPIVGKKYNFILLTVEKTK